MRRLLLPLAALLISDALLLMGHGLQLTLLPIRAEIEQFTNTQVAVTGSAYFVGFVVGCVLAPFIIRRVGHIRAFAVLASGISALVLLFHALPYFEYWLLLRFFVGCCVSGLYMLIESWLNDQSTSRTRGTVLSIYTMINLIMIVVGQQLLRLAEPSAGLLFALSSIMISLAIIPVSLTLTLAPAPIHSVRLDFRRLWEISHVGVLGAVVSGLVTGAFWSLGPIFARGVGLDTAGLTLFMSAAVIGGAVFQLPLGRLSDHVDRRLVLLFTSLAGALFSALIVLLAVRGNALLILAGLWGGMVMTQYAIALAHAADNSHPEEFALVGSCMLLLLGLSSALGGPLAAFFMEWLGPTGLYTFSALSLVLSAVFITVRRKHHVLSEQPEAEPYRSTTLITSPAVYELDPRTEEHEPGLELQTDTEDTGGSDSADPRADGEFRA